MRFSAAIFFSAFCISLAASTNVFAADAKSLPEDRAGKPEIAGQCLRDLQSFDEKLARVGFGIEPPRESAMPEPQSYYRWGGVATPRQRIRSLRFAAIAYAHDGDEPMCQSILASMRKVFEKHQKVVEKGADDPHLRSAWRRAHLSRAEPVDRMNHLMRADIMIGSEIRNLKDQRLGEIEDIVFNPHERKILYVLISRGGFAGIGKKFVAIRWNDLQATPDHELYLFDAPVKALKEAPEVDRRNFAKTASPEWQRALAVYWDRILKP